MEGGPSSVDLLETGGLLRVYASPMSDTEGQPQAAVESESLPRTRFIKQCVVALLATLGTLAIGSCASRPGVMELELSDGGPFDASWVPRVIAWDFVFIAAYTALALGLLRWRRPKHRRSSTYRVLVIALPTCLAVADVVENLLILCKRWDSDIAHLLGWLHTVSHIKWYLAGGVVITVLWQFRRRVPTPSLTEGARVQPNLPTRPGQSVVRGIALSGGGIRSAAFGLGGLHGLGAQVVRDADYLSAASGGAYTASAISVAAARQAALAGNQQTQDGPSPLPFGHGSAELKQLRAHSSYLIFSGSDARFAIGRVLAGVVVNLLVLFGVVFIVARPLGWATSYVHPELHALTPFVAEVELSGDFTPTVAPLAESASEGKDTHHGGECNESGGDEQYWSLGPASSAVKVSYWQRATVTTHNIDKHGLMEFSVLPGLVRSCGPDIEVVRQPSIEVQPPFKVTDYLTYKVLGAATNPVPSAEEVAIQLARDTALELGPSDQDVDRPNITVEAWMWLVLGVLAAATLLAFGFPWSGNSSLPTLRTGRISLMPILMTVWGVFFVGLPWLEQELPRFFPDIPKMLGGVAPPQSILGAGATWLVGAITAGGLAKKATVMLAKGGQSKPMKYTLTMMKGSAVVVLTLVGALVIVLVANQAAMVTPTGTGIGAKDMFGGVFFRASDLEKWVFTLVVMIFAKEFLAAHTWSFNPIYRDRLSRAFSLDSPPPNGWERSDDHPVENLTGWAQGEQPEPAGDEALKWPDLIICCAANINDEATKLPAKRWADSFIVSKENVGSPSLGYLSGADYSSRLGVWRRRDISVPSVVATSGAAFSPAMGKENFGAIGGLFAALNLRLGVWLPNPASVQGAAPNSWKANPGWQYLLRELFGQYRVADPFVYVTDGGHWENLAMVELLRHNCNEVIVLSAAGDGVNFFPTLGEAIALAREELGIEIELDPSGLRPRRGEPLPTGGPQLLNISEGEVVPQPIASSPFVVGRFWRSDSTPGCILFVEATLTQGMPWDVHSFAESNPIFPDHPTGNQFFNDRIFEAYRRLGEYQAQAAITSPQWVEAKAWRDGNPPSGNTVPGPLGSS